MTVQVRKNTYVEWLKDVRRVRWYKDHVYMICPCYTDEFVCDVCLVSIKEEKAFLSIEKWHQYLLEPPNSDIAVGPARLTEIILPV
jgi:hypothetical protein